MAHTKRGWSIYTSDPIPFSGVNFSLKTDATTAANNGVSQSVAPPILNFWPLHTADLRHGYGVDAGGVRDSCVSLGTGTPVFTLGGNFADYEGNTYTVVGLRNERFRTRDLK